jgi:nicotinic acid mononucleotide adenylyltransferase
MMNNTCIDLSSTTIRSRIESGLPVKELMPKEAYRYLMEKNLISPSS